VLDKLFQLGATTSELWPKGGANVMWKWGGAMGCGLRVVGDSGLTCKWIRSAIWLGPSPGL